MSTPNMPNVPKLTEERTALLQLARDFAERFREYDTLFSQQLDTVTRQVGDIVSTALPPLRQLVDVSLGATAAATQAGDEALQRLGALTAVAPDVLEREARARAAADTMAAAEQARQETLAALARRGLDPSQLAATALDRSLRVASAAQAAQAANTAGLQAREQYGQLAALQGQLAGRLADVSGTTAARAGALQSELAQLATLPLQARVQSAQTLGRMGATAAGLYGTKADLDLRRFEYKLQKAGIKRQESMGLYGGIGQLVGQLGGAAIGGYFGYGGGA